MNIKLKMIVFTILPVIAIFAVTMGFIVWFTMNHVTMDMEKYLIARSNENGAILKAELELSMDAARTLAQIIENVYEFNTGMRRDVLNRFVKAVAEKNPAFHGVWAIFEPDVIDGRDFMYKNTPGHDFTGRVMPYYFRDEQNVLKRKESPQSSYLKEGDGDYYQLPLKRAKETVAEPYEFLVDNKPVMMTTLSVPVMKDGKAIGVVGIDLSLSHLQERYAGITVYKTGFSRIVSPKGNVLVHQGIERVGKIWGEDKDENGKELLARVANGESFVLKTYSVVLKRYTTKSFAPVFIGKDENPWMFGLVVPTEEVFESSTIMITRMIVIFVIGLLLYVLFNIFTTARIVKPIIIINKMMNEIAVGEGDLTKRLVVYSKDEIGMLATNFNLFMEKLIAVITDLGEINVKGRAIGDNLAASSEETSSTINEISATIQSMDERVSSLKTQIDKTANASTNISQLISQVDVLIEEQTESVSDSSSSIAQMIASIQSLENTTENRKNAVDVLVEKARDGEQSMKETVVAIEEISKSAEAIFDMVAIIDNITGQTDLLAMNAAIEAAHAGDSGKGFAVVADEIRKLAESTGNNAREITVTLRSVVSNIKETAEKTVNTGDKLSEIITDIELTSSSMNEMLAGMKELTSGSRSITEALEKLQNISHKVKSQSSQVSSTIGEIDEYVKEIANFAMETHNGMGEVSIGMQDISKSSAMLTHLGIENSGNLETLQKNIDTFKIK